MLSRLICEENDSADHEGMVFSRSAHFLTQSQYFIFGYQFEPFEEELFIFVLLMPDDGNP